MSAPQTDVLPLLSKRQRQVLQAIVEATLSNGMAPTYRELAKVLGISSTNAVNDHLRRFKELGLIAWQPGKARSIRVLAPHARPAASCVCAEALALLEAGNPEGAREILAAAVRGAEPRGTTQAGPSGAQEQHHGSEESRRSGDPA